MNVVQPIREPEVIEQICAYLREKNQRNYLLFLSGIYLGLRVSDHRWLRVEEIRDQTHILRREQKTGKMTRLQVPDILRREAKRLLAGRDGQALLFPSRNGGGNKPIERWMVYRIVQQAARAAGIKDPIGCHTLRKTFGYHHYQQFRDVQFLMRWFNHSDQLVTLRYIGVTQAQDDARMRKFQIGTAKRN